MTSSAARLALLCAFLAPVASAQFAISVVTGTTETPAAAAFQLGSFRQGETATVHLRIRNVSSAIATLNPLHLDGIGFVLSDAPDEPSALAPQAHVEVSISFQAMEVGSFSGFLYSDRVSLLITVVVLPPLVLRLDSASGNLLPDNIAADLGTVDRGIRIRRLFVLENRAAVSAVVPLIAVNGTGFGLDSSSPFGSTLQARDTAAFEVGFVSSNTGDFVGTLSVGDRKYALTVTVREPALPKPILSLDLPATRSAEQGAVRIRYDAMARTSGTGVLTLGFVPVRGSDDPAIQFASGKRRLEFPIALGDLETPEFRFQTGTVAGVLTFAADIGGVIDQQTVTIDSAPVTLTAVEALRSVSSIEVRLTGFDNTRTAGALAFTFYDSSGGPIAPGAIRSEAASSFAAYFSGSGLGGVFQLRTVFPITGSAEGIAAVEAEIVNAAGTTRISRTKIN